MSVVPRVGAAEVIESVEASLHRLRRDTVDVVQFHGGFYSEADARHILENGPLDGLVRPREQGKARFLGFTTEEPFTALPLSPPAPLMSCRCATTS